MVAFSQCVFVCKPQPQPGWTPGAHPCATSPAVCPLEELRFHVDNKGLDLISLAAVKLPTHVAGLPQVSQMHFLQRGSPREALSEVLLLECSLSLLSFLLGTLTQGSQALPTATGHWDFACLPWNLLVGLCVPPVSTEHETAALDVNHCQVRGAEPKVLVLCGESKARLRQCKDQMSHQYMIDLGPKRIIKEFPLPGFSDLIHYQFRVQLSRLCVRYTSHPCSPEFPFSYLKWRKLQCLRPEQTLEHDADVIPELGEGQDNSFHLFSRSLLCPPVHGTGLSVLSESNGSSELALPDSAITSGHCGDQPGLTWGIRSFLCICDGKILWEIIISFQLCIQTNQVLH